MLTEIYHVLTEIHGFVEKNDFSKSKKCSNFFVFQSYELRFSGIFCPVLIRSFPGSFVKKSILSGVPHKFIVEQNFTLLNFMKFHSKSGHFPTFQVYRVIRNTSVDLRITRNIV